MKQILAIAAAIALTGCATQSGFRNNMDAYIGSSVNTLVSAFGPPQSEYPMPDGSKVLTYSRSQTIQMGGYTQYVPVTSRTKEGVGDTRVYTKTTTYQPVQSPVYDINFNCTTNFNIDARGIVRGWNANGNNCVS